MAHLTREQRYTISVMHRKGYKQKDIAATIGKDKSVVSRELQRNANRRGQYSYGYAQMCADIRKERLSRPRKLKPDVKWRIAHYVGRKQWSPEQLVGYCRKEGLPMVCVEMVYRYIRTDKARGGTLYECCRHRLKHRRRPVGHAIPIKGRVGIEERPPEADGTRFGDWEMDLIVGRGGKGAMLTLVERSQGYIVISTLPCGKDADGVLRAAYRELLPFKGTIRSITTDNGTEFARHAELSKLLGTQIYFTHPYSAWEKGLIEYSNKLIRQYIPKNADFREFTQEIVKQLQYKINARPRKKLGYNMPYKTFYAILQKNVAF